MKHTPGPWELSEAEYKEGFGTYRRVEQVEQFGDVVGSVCVRHAVNHTLDACGDANARLIAAAPDLLEACQTFAEWLRREDAGFDHKTHDRKTPEGEAAWRKWFYDNLCICDLAQDQARAAIVKATGEQP
jgi:hypothetical protein